MPEFDPANIEINRRMHDQLALSLRSLTAVNDVELLVEGAPVELGAGWTDAAPVQDVTVPSRQVGLREGDLVFYQGGQTENVDGIPPLDARCGLRSLPAPEGTPEQPGHAALRR